MGEAALNDAGGGGFWGSVGAGIGDSMQAFAASAGAGGFAVSETAGQDMLNAIHKLQDRLEVRVRDLSLLREQPPLGSSHGAEVVKPFNVQVATDDQGFITRLRQLQDSLAKAEEGIRKAMENYRNAEQDNQRKFPGA